MKLSESIQIYEKMLKIKKNSFMQKIALISGLFVFFSLIWFFTSMMFEPALQPNAEKPNLNKPKELNPGEKIDPSKSHKFSNVEHPEKPKLPSKEKKE